MRLFARNDSVRTVCRGSHAASCKQQLIQAAQTDTAQALNPKSLVSTTNKLQQFVAEVERLELANFETVRVPVIDESGGAGRRDSQSCLRLAPGKVVAQGGDGIPPPAWRADASRLASGDDERPARHVGHQPDADNVAPGKFERLRRLPEAGEAQPPRTTFRGSDALADRKSDREPVGGKGLRRSELISRLG